MRKMRKYDLFGDPPPSSLLSFSLSHSLVYYYFGRHQQAGEYSKHLFVIPEEFRLLGLVENYAHFLREKQKQRYSSFVYRYFL